MKETKRKNLCKMKKRAEKERVPIENYEKMKTKENIYLYERTRTREWEKSIQRTYVCYTKKNPVRQNHINPWNYIMSYYMHPENDETDEETREFILWEKNPEYCLLYKKKEHENEESKKTVMRRKLWNIYMSIWEREETLFICLLSMFETIWKPEKKTYCYCSVIYYPYDHIICYMLLLLLLLLFIVRNHYPENHYIVIVPLWKREPIKSILFVHIMPYPYCLLFCLYILSMSVLWKTLSILLCERDLLPPWKRMRGERKRMKKERDATRKNGERAQRKWQREKWESYMQTHEMHEKDLRNERELFIWKRERTRRWKWEREKRDESRDETREDPENLWVRMNERKRERERKWENERENLWKLYERWKESYILHPFETNHIYIQAWRKKVYVYERRGEI